MNHNDAQTIRNAADGQVVIDYSDDDIIFIDNIKQVTAPNPLRLQMNTLGVCINGRMQVDVSGRTVQVGKNQVFFCPPNVMLDNYLFSSDFECKIICMTNQLIQNFLREKMNIWNEVMYVQKSNVMTMEPQDILFFERFYDLMRLCIDASHDAYYRSEVIKSLLRGAVLGLCGALRQQILSAEELQMKHTDSLFQRFLNLLGHSEVKRRPVEHYADLLCISPKYLSTVCKKSSGKTANEWITEYAMEDIRYQLLSTDKPIKEISHQLGFPNTSFFGRYVREHFGTTPKAIRNGRQ